MTSDEFLQSLAKYKYGKKKEAKPEEPKTWLMVESGLYFLLEGDLDAKLKQMHADGITCTVHHNMTSLDMSHEQAKLERFNK